MQPKRLLAAHGGPSDVSRLLRAAQRDRPPEGLRHATWKELAAQTALVGVALGTTVSAAAKGSGLTAATSSSTGSYLGAGTLLSKTAVIATMKSIILGVGIGGGIATTYAVATRFSEPTAEQRPAQRGWSVSVSPREPRSAVGKEKAPLPSVSVPDATEGLAPNGATSKALGIVNTQSKTMPHKVSYAAAVRLEAQRVSEARSSIRNGNGSAALRMLAELEIASPGGLLRQERDALRIDALFLTGRRQEALQLVRQFSTRYPNSPLTTRWSTQEQRVD